MNKTHRLKIEKIGDGDIIINCICGWKYELYGTVGHYTTQHAIDIFEEEHLIKRKF